MNWTEEQEEIFKEVSQGSSHLVIEALAGTGKSSTITHSAKCVSKNMSIAFAAFNKHIADYLKDKIPDNATAFTMNSFGYRIVREAFNSKVNPYKLDDILKDLIDEKDPMTYLRGPIKQLINLCKYNLLSGKNRSELQNLVDKHDIDFQYQERDVLDLIPEILEECRANKGEIDFTDQLWFVHQFNLPVTQYDVFYGDEVQDWNPLQSFLAFRAIEKGGRLVLCGDFNQSIYAWSGADSDSMPNLIKRCKETDKGVKQLPLTTTWRCPVSHVKLAQQIVPGIKASPTAKEGVVQEIKVKEALKIIKPNDFVICRRNAPLIKLCFQLIREEKTVIVKGRDIGANIKNLVKKLKATGIPNLIEKAEKYRLRETTRFKKEGDRCEQKIIALNDKVDTLIALCEGVRGPKELEDKIEEIFSDVNIKNAIILSSVHKAKGLEADNVFILESNMIRIPMKQAWAQLQEKNLEYIAKTRSKENLYLLTY